ncbi:MAG: right-handed parallel beta-helix repeat-containing protein [Deltaproteobacteria bacterium]|nr:right-handed parallel beta-helix repeat-containing protein [Deltaproteobacteria bacterium]
MRAFGPILASTLSGLLAACSVDYAGLLSGKKCDPSGACAADYACDRSTWACVPANELKPGTTGDGGVGADLGMPNDSGDQPRDGGTGADIADDAAGAGDADPGGDTGATPDTEPDASLDSGPDGSYDTGPDASLDSGFDGSLDTGPDAGGCTPTPHAASVCHNNDVYWVDSCGNIEEVKDDCAGSQVCLGAACCTPATCAGLGRECGAWDDGCGGSVNCPACGGSKLCRGGSCRAVIFVKSDAAGAGDGSSWTDAFTVVQDALDAAADGSEVWIAGGQYTRKGNSAEVARLKQGVNVYGGFAGTETRLEDRDLGAGNETRLVGQNGVRVVVGAGNSSLDGITITGGLFTGGDGGGVYLSNISQVKIANCIITGNSAHWGGGIYLFQSEADVADTVISANAAVDGGGIFNQNSVVRLTGSTVSGNVSQGAIGGGGGIFNDNAASTVTNCVFHGNSAQGAFAGGIYNNYTSTHTVTNCTFYGNSAKLGGAAIFNNINASPEIVNSIFWNDSPDEVYDYPGYGSNARVRYSDIRGGRNGDGNINADPAFVNAGNGNFQLAPGSPCIDAADGDAAPPKDKDGAVRTDDPAIGDTGKGAPPYADIGALERVP